MPTPIVFTYHSSSALLTESRSLIFCIAVADLYVYALLSFFLSAVLDGPSNATHDFEAATSLVESSALLPFPSGVQSFVSDAGLFSVLQGRPLDYGQAYIAYHRSVEGDWGDEECVG